MATELTARAKNRSQQVRQIPQIVLEIEGIPWILGVGNVANFVRIGQPNLYINDLDDEWTDWYIGGLLPIQNQKSIITFDGTADSFSQQLNIDQGGSTSIASIPIALVDDGFATKLITPGAIVNDILGRKAFLSVGYRGTAYPQDFTQKFAGIIDETIGGTAVVLNIAHPEAKKRGEAFQKISTYLTAEARFRSRTIQGVIYRTRRDVLGSVTITYLADGTAGSELVEVVGNAITVHVQSGVSTANDVRDAIENSIAALSLVTVEIGENSEGESLGNTLQTAQSSTILDSDTTLQVQSTAGMKLPVPSEGLRSYVRIDDEIIEYTGISGNTLTGCVREAMRVQEPRAYGQHHEIDATVDTFYRMQGSAVDLALKLMLSSDEEYFAKEVKFKHIGYADSLGDVENCVFFEGTNIADKYGIVVGDFFTIQDELNPSNNVTLAVVQGVVVTEYGSYLTTETPLTQSINSPGTISLKSKYNVWTDGLQLGGDQVDVPQFEYIRDTYISSIMPYDWYIKDTMKGKEWVDTKFLMPTGAFSVPRKGKISVGYSAPPLSVFDLVEFNSSNTTAPDQNKITRTINRNFYNQIIFKYNDSVLDDKFLSGDIRVDEDSRNRVPVGKKPRTIEVGGLRPSDTSEDQLRIIGERMLERYKFGAEEINVQVFFGDSFNQDIGDIVLFGDENLQLPDTKQGDRVFQKRLMEIQNTKFSIQTGKNTVKLVDTAYSAVNAAYGIVSPSSEVDSGSTTTTIQIKRSFAWPEPRLEKDKWQKFIGQKILVHAPDFSYSAETVLKGFANDDANRMEIDPALPFTPAASDIVDVVNYPNNTDKKDALVYKRVFVFSDPSIPVVDAADQFHLEVSPSDIGLFRPGQSVQVHNDDWSVMAPELLVDEVVGNIITLSGDMGFVPDSTFTIELIGFPDGGYPYRYV